MVDQRGFDNQPWLSAAQAAALLGVERRTLYAYVARGLLRSAPGPRGRARRYERGEVERLAARHRARAGHGAVAAGALRWGDPVLDSAVTALGDGGPVYRGHAAVALAARRVGLERTAELLWSGVLPDAAPDWPRVVAAWGPIARLVPSDGAPGAALPVVVAALGLREPDRHDARPEAELARARALIPLLAAGVAPERAAHALEAPTVAGIVARALGRASSREVAAALDAALVLMADHELNASTFAARVAASTGADLHACIGAALATLSGPRHGAMTARVEALVDEAGSARRAAATLRDRMARGDDLPGFGHRLYRDGDPRASPILRLARALGPARPRVGIALALAAAGPAVAGAHPTCDLGLVALSSALGLPRGAPAALFAVGRSAGWVAHILEQRAAGFLIRPRASGGAARDPGAP
ncbi:MAG TPA: citrate/2-methylcitrate synthase [Kofleriaceae bacterium]|nr:citrate/2-methylcitrate synthase [Kofleriaceae bacterium]